MRADSMHILSLVSYTNTRVFLETINVALGLLEDVPYVIDVWGLSAMRHFGPLRRGERGEGKEKGEGEATWKHKGR